MELHPLLKRQSDAKTPLLVKIGVVIGIWFLAGAWVKELSSLSLMTTFTTVLILLQALAYVAIWNLRRWGVYAGVLLGIVSLVSIAVYATANPVSFKVVIAVLVLRMLPILPAFLYWGRFKAKGVTNPGSGNTIG